MGRVGVSLELVLLNDQYVYLLLIGFQCRTCNRAFDCVGKCSLLVCGAWYGLSADVSCEVSHSLSQRGLIWPFTSHYSWNPNGGSAFFFLSHPVTVYVCIYMCVRERESLFNPYIADLVSMSSLPHVAHLYVCRLKAEDPTLWQIISSFILRGKTRKTFLTTLTCIKNIKNTPVSCLVVPALSRIRAGCDPDWMLILFSARFTHGWLYSVTLLCLHHSVIRKRR